MDIIDLYQNIQKIDKVFLMQQSILDNENIIVDSNRSQLLEGKDNQDRDISPRYANNTYADVKQTINSQPSFGVPDLKATGDFHKAMIMAVNSQDFFITSTDSKTRDLSVKYLDIFGLNEKSLSKVSPIITNNFYNKYLKAAGLD